MKSLDALTVAVAVPGALLTYLALGPAAGVFFIWAVFLTTGLGFALGGDNAAFKDVTITGLYGVVLGWAAVLIIINVPLADVITLEGWAAIVVLVTAALLVQTSRIPLLATIPGVVAGYAMVFAYVLQTPTTLANEVLLAASLENPLVVIAISVVVGAAYGVVAVLLAGRLTAGRQRSRRPHTPGRARG